MTEEIKDETYFRLKEEYLSELQRLKQENELLKKEKQAIKSYLGIESKSILERLEEIYEWKDNDKLLLWKYRSVLEEIREYCEEQNLKADYTACEIIDKINEVLK